MTVVAGWWDKIILRTKQSIILHQTMFVSVHLTRIMNYSSDNVFLLFLGRWVHVMHTHVTNKKTQLGCGQLGHTGRAKLLHMNPPVIQREIRNYVLNNKLVAQQCHTRWTLSVLQLRHLTMSRSLVYHNSRERWLRNIFASHTVGKCHQGISQLRI